MATFDQLPADQRAIIELVLRRGRRYDDLADMLDMPSSRVRELARDALMELAPASGRRVEDERRGQVTDYVLGQQSNAEETATRAYLRRSEAGRAWTMSLIDSLDAMYDGDRPEVPEAAPAEAPRRRERDRGRERERARDRGRDREPLSRDEPAPRREREPLRREPLSPEAQAAVRRRRRLGGLLGLLVIAAAVLAVVLLTGGSDKKSSKTASRPQPRIVGELLLRPVGGGSSDQGIAIVAQRGKERDLIVQAKLTPTKQGQAYEVWLYNSRTNAVAVGAQVTDQQGNYQGAGKLPADLSRFQAIDVSLQAIPSAQCQRNPTCLRRSQVHSGRSVLRGQLSQMRAPGAAGATSTPGGQPTTPGQPTAPGQPTTPGQP